MMRPPGAPTEGLQQLASVLKPGTSMVEVGSWAGESARIWIASGNVSSIILVDPYLDELAVAELEHDETRERSAEEAMASAQRVVSSFPGAQLLRMTSAHAAELLSGQEFDFVYIDANHTYESVLEDIRLWLPLVKADGIIAGHDYNPVDFPGVIQAVNEVFGVPERVFIDHSWMTHKGWA